MQVELELETLSEGAGVLQAPPNSSVAPPGLYMLFLLSEGVPSTAVWVGPLLVHMPCSLCSR